MNEEITSTKAPDEAVFPASALLGRWLCPCGAKPSPSQETERCCWWCGKLIPAKAFWDSNPNSIARTSFETSGCAPPLPSSQSGATQVILGISQSGREIHKEWDEMTKATIPDRVRRQIASLGVSPHQFLNPLTLIPRPRRMIVRLLQWIACKASQGTQVLLSKTTNYDNTVACLQASRQERTYMAYLNLAMSEVKTKNRVRLSFGDVVIEDGSVALTFRSLTIMSVCLRLSL